MPKLPKVPESRTLNELEPELKVLEPGTMLHRIYRRGGAYPGLWNAFRHYGPTASRFDHHVRDENGHAHVQACGAIYAATDIVTAIAEVFQQRRLVNRKLDAPWLVSAQTGSELSLLDLTDTFALRAGASMKLMSGPTVFSQAWSRGFHDAYPDIDGLYYPSSLTNRPVLMLNERALVKGPFEQPPQFHRALDDTLLLEPLRNACRDIGFDLL